MVDSLTADPLQLFPGGASELSCVASDPENDPVSYSWQADSGTITGGVDGTATFTSSM